MSIKEGGKAVSVSVSIKTTVSKAGVHLNKHCFAGTCGGKVIKGNGSSKHYKTHSDKNEENNVKVCIGEECEECVAYESAKGKYTLNLHIKSKT